MRTAIVSHIGLNPETQRQMHAGEIAVELVPQGTLIERIRAGGFGLGGVLTPTGVGTIVEDGKRKIDVDGETFLLEAPLRGDFALVHAFLADYLGNFSYALTARNFNPLVAMAARGISEDEVVRDVLLHAQPTHQFVTAEQIGALAVFLCSESAAQITGAAIPIEGGWTAQ